MAHLYITVCERQGQGKESLIPLSIAGVTDCETLLFLGVQGHSWEEMRSENAG